MFCRNGGNLEFCCSENKETNKTTNKNRIGSNYEILTKQMPWVKNFKGLTTLHQSKIYAFYISAHLPPRHPIISFERKRTQNGRRIVNRVY